MRDAVDGLLELAENARSLLNEAELSVVLLIGVVHVQIDLLRNFEEACKFAKQTHRGKIALGLVPENQIIA